MRALRELERQQTDASWGKSRLRPWRRVSGKLTRPLTNRLTPTLIDFLQRAPFANGVSAPSVTSGPVDVTLPDLIAAATSTPIPGPRARSSPPERSGPVFRANLFVHTFAPPEKSPGSPFRIPRDPDVSWHAGYGTRRLPRCEKSHLHHLLGAETSTRGRGGEKRNSSMQTRPSCLRRPRCTLLRSSEASAVTYRTLPRHLDALNLLGS